MQDGWWQDVFDRREQWQGLSLHVRAGERAAGGLQVHSGHNGRFKVMVGDDTLFWATVAEDHAGVWLIRNLDADRSTCGLPPIRSADMARAAGAPAQPLSFWCRFFARRLFSGDSPMLSAGQWLLRPMTYQTPKAPRAIAGSQPLARWRFSSPSAEGGYLGEWQCYGSDITSLTEPEPVFWVDWWWGGDALLAAHAVTPEASRLKWWRKKSREGTLPPVLVWFFRGLESYVILDGHYRMQAALETGIPPDFVVLSEIHEQRFTADPTHQARIVASLQRQQQRNPGMSIDAINQVLINTYDDRGVLSRIARSRALLGNGADWEREVSTYLHRRQLTRHLSPVLSRQSG